MGKKISVIGCGKVGATTAFAIAARGLVDEIVMMDVAKDKARGEAMDISHGAIFTDTVVRYGEYPDLAGSDVIVFAAGMGRKPGETRLDLAAKNVAIAREAAAEIKKYYDGGVVLCVTNPVDVITYTMTRELQLPKGSVIGTGTALDSARFKDEICKKLDIAKSDMMACILGEHGDSCVPVWDMTIVNGLHIGAYCDAAGIKFDDAVKAEIFADMKSAGADIIALKGATYYGIASAITGICKAVVRNSNTLMPISATMHGEYGINDTAISLLGIVGKNGVSRFLMPDLGEHEIKLLRESAARVRSEIDKL